MPLPSEAAAGANLAAGTVASGPDGTDPLSAERLRSAAVRVGALVQSRVLTGADVSHALLRGRLAEAAVITARLADEDPEAFVQALRGSSPVTNLALLVMRSAGLTWAMAEQVLREAGSTNIVQQREAYAGLSRVAAQRSLRAVRLRAGFTILKGGPQQD